MLQEFFTKLNSLEPVGLELAFKPQQVIAAEPSEDSESEAEQSGKAAAACMALNSMESPGPRAGGIHDSASRDWEEDPSSAEFQMEPTHAQQRADEERASLETGSARQRSARVARQLGVARPCSADKDRQLGRASREEAAALRQRCNQLEQRCASLESDLEDASCRLGEEKLEAQQLIRQIRDELAAAEQALHTAEQEAEQLRHDCQSFADDADDYAWELQQLQQEAPDLEERIDLRERCMAMSQRIFATEDANKTLEAMLAMQSVEVEDLETIEAELTAILYCNEQVCSLIAAIQMSSCWTATIYTCIPKTIQRIDRILCRRDAGCAAPARVPRDADGKS